MSSWKTSESVGDRLLWTKWLLHPMQHGRRFMTYFETRAFECAKWCYWGEIDGNWLWVVVGLSLCHRVWHCFARDFRIVYDGWLNWLSGGAWAFPSFSTWTGCIKHSDLREKHDPTYRPSQGLKPMQVHRASTSSRPGSSGKADKVCETGAVPRSANVHVYCKSPRGFGQGCCYQCYRKVYLSIALHLSPDEASNCNEVSQSDILDYIRYVRSWFWVFFFAPCTTCTLQIAVFPQVWKSKGLQRAIDFPTCPGGFPTWYPFWWRLQDCWNSQVSQREKDVVVWYGLHKIGLMWLQTWWRLEVISDNYCVSSLALGWTDVVFDCAIPFQAEHLDTTWLLIWWFTLNFEVLDWYFLECSDWILWYMIGHFGSILTAIMHSLTGFP